MFEVHVMVFLPHAVERVRRKQLQVVRVLAHVKKMQDYPLGNHEAGAHLRKPGVF